MPDKDVEMHELGPEILYWFETDVKPWIGRGHADLISLVGHGAIRRTTIDTGRLVTNWQAWVGPSSIADAAGEMMPWAPNTTFPRRQVDALSDDVQSKANSGTIIDKTIIFNNAPYALVEEEKHGKFMAQGACDEAESNWGDGSP